MRSESRPDVSEVVVELTWGASLDEAAQRQARRNVDASVTRLLKLFARNGLFEAAQ